MDNNQLLEKITTNLLSNKYSNEDINADLVIKIQKEIHELDNEVYKKLKEDRDKNNKRLFVDARI